MRAGAKKAQDLKQRLETVESEIDAWDRKESEWQAGVSRLLRVFWAVVLTIIVVVMVVTAVEKIRPSSSLLPSDGGDSDGAFGQDIISSERVIDTCTLPSFPSGDAGECVAQYRQESTSTSLYTSSLLNETSDNISASSPLAMPTTSVPTGALEEPLQRVIDEL